MKRDCYRILLADDDENDLALLRWALEEALGDAGSVNTVPDGEEAIRYMRGEGEYSDRRKYPFPSLVMFDLKMPRADGLDVLQFMKKNPAWHVIPRIIFSASVDDDDVKKAYLVGATVYHQKPNTPDELKRTVKRIVDYWMSCEIPPMDDNGRLRMTDSRGKIGERIPQPEGGEMMERAD